MIYDFGKILNDQELTELKSAIKSNRNLWTHETTYWGKYQRAQPINFLGSPIYPASSAPQLYSGLRAKSQEFLTTNCSELLKRTLQCVAEKYNRSVIEHLPNTSLPGFHVLHSESPCFVKYEYHQDNDFLEFTEADFNFNDFYSFTVAIELPKSGAWLDYNDGAIFPYSDGHAYSWKSDLDHKIGDVTLSGPDDYRITYQGHFILQPDKLLYYW
jgi:hypothetical protein